MDHHGNPDFLRFIFRTRIFLLPLKDLVCSGESATKYLLQKNANIRLSIVMALNQPNRNYLHVFEDLTIGQSMGSYM
jgi:hypothetical protein